MLTGEKCKWVVGPASKACPSQACPQFCFLSRPIMCHLAVFQKIAEYRVAEDVLLAEYEKLGEDQQAGPHWETEPGPGYSRHSVLQGRQETGKEQASLRFRVLLSLCQISTGLMTAHQMLKQSFASSTKRW